eukprot:comp5776_c0_seq1/m.1644 comp5776_c0_seq1/g.1644  ORF comp5776_c0_seq1/g.1644 comp5776_c0_seq1/m.1644 type:complete len:133 (-) comp5776_c0_seq1:332-730(-)
MTSVSAGKILLIREIKQDLKAVDGASVRVVGKLVRVDMAANHVVLMHEGYELRIDTSILDPINWRLSSSFQVIGEVRVEPGAQDGETTDTGKVWLRARVGRCVDGMDMGLFLEALAIRRKFLDQPPTPQTVT